MWIAASRRQGALERSERGAVSDALDDAAAAVTPGLSVVQFAPVLSEEAHTNSPSSSSIALAGRRGRV